MSSSDDHLKEQPIRHIYPIFNQTKGKWFKEVLRRGGSADYLVASWTSNLANVVATFPGDDREEHIQRTLADLKRSYPYDTFITEAYAVQLVFTKIGAK